MVFISISLLLCLVINFPSSTCYKLYIKPPWDNIKTTLLPPATKDPMFYEKIRKEIPSKNETVKKLIKNFFRISTRSKRQIEFQDIVVLMDGSGSIGECEFKNQKNAARGLMLYDKPGTNATYAVVTFADTARRDFKFLPQQEAAVRITDVTFPSGWTNTQAGLAEAFKLMETGSRGFNSRKIVLLFTDGLSNINRHKTIPNAQKLKSKGVEVFVVAVGDEHVRGIKEMVDIATSLNHLFRVRKVNDFVDIVKMAIKKVAPGKYKILEKYISGCPLNF